MAITDIDEAKLEAFIGHAATELGAALNTALVTLGEELGLYKAMADGQPVTAAELAARTGTVERYVGEWLNTQAASGFVVYDEDATRSCCRPSTRWCSPTRRARTRCWAPSRPRTPPSRCASASPRASWTATASAGTSTTTTCSMAPSGRSRRATGNFLVSDWLPALDGVVEKLEAGALVADIGCGHGASSIQLAQAFPNSRFVGDRLPRGVDRDRAPAGGDRGVADRVRFEVAGAADLPGEGYDLIAFFDALHDLGDPLAAARAASGALAPDGTCMIVEPFAGDSVAENLNPVGRFYYGFSTLVCTPGSLSQPGRAGLGTQAGEARLAEVLIAGGFAGVRRAAESPLNLVLEARLLATRAAGYVGGRERPPRPRRAPARRRSAGRAGRGAPALLRRRARGALPDDRRPARARRAGRCRKPVFDYVDGAAVGRGHLRAQPVGVRARHAAAAGARRRVGRSRWRRRCSGREIALPILARADRADRAHAPGRRGRGRARRPRRGPIYTLSTMASYTLEEVADGRARPALVPALRDDGPRARQRPARARGGERLRGADADRRRPGGRRARARRPQPLLDPAADDAADAGAGRHPPALVRGLRRPPADHARQPRLVGQHGRDARQRRQPRRSTRP